MNDINGYIYPKGRAPPAQHNANYYRVLGIFIDIKLYIIIANIMH